MASAPKKPRTGDPPAVETQPRAEQMPEVSGDPPVDEPRLEEESSIDVPPTRPPLRLRMKGRKCVQFHVAKEHERAMDPGNDSDSDWPLSPTRVLLVNRSFLNAFFDSEPFGVAQIFFPLRHTVLGKFGGWPDWPVPFAQTVAGIVALLRLSRNLTTIGVKWEVEPGYADFETILEWMQVASELHGKPHSDSCFIFCYLQLCPGWHRSN